ncbi:hypothetical protein NC652_003041 [Populus alba x Populus x berolinensis]|uniref:Uncharacterized protein n=1 Tax=Populus alba x Populus x berolinensis TaxID=444605 RepID=A0AAD6RQN2_9ROSI|nr:hypothetical protein NC652_003041 [Populus alba x Populus x berolinensis]KAJ7013336.1 hypothetical protein NC653_003123 [Populus alba x Populus x berolinensis]
MIACLPTSTTWAWPVESSKSQGRTPVPFLREDGKGTLREVVVLAGAGRVIGSLSSSGLDSGGVCGRDLMVGGGGEFYWDKQEDAWFWESSGVFASDSLHIHSISK